MQAVIDFIVPAYVTGLGYSIIGGVIISLLFAIYRWTVCVQQYIKTGKIDEADDSWFMGSSNWFHGSNNNYDYGTHPWVNAVDILTLSVLGVILSIAWPVTAIATIVITYAKVARVRFARKKEFIDRLQGEHVEAT